MADRLISADALKMIRFVAPKHKEPEAEAYMTGWNDAIDSIIDNAPTIDINLQELEDRYGKEVRFVVEDMISGEGMRWKGWKERG